MVAQCPTPGLRSGGRPIFDHPAIAAAIRTIEEAAAHGEKVLVFGRFVPARLVHCSTCERPRDAAPLGQGRPLAPIEGA